MSQKEIVYCLGCNSKLEVGGGTIQFICRYCGTIMKREQRGVPWVKIL